MKQLSIIIAIIVLASSGAAFSMGTPPKSAVKPTAEAEAKQKAKGGKFTTDKNKVKETRMLQQLKEENVYKQGETPLPTESGEDVHPSGQF